MATINLGRVKPISRGEYAPAFEYRELDFVSFNGAFWVANQEVTGVEPSAVASEWDFVVGISSLTELGVSQFSSDLLGLTDAQSWRAAAALNVLQAGTGEGQSRTNQQNDARYFGPMGVKTEADIDVNGVLELTVDNGRYITLDWNGDTDLEITGFGDQLPVGYTFDIYIPRTIGNVGGAAKTLGNKVAFLHTSTADGLDLELNLRMDSGSELYTYEAYPNATDAFGNRSALLEKISFVEIGGGRQRLIKMPDDAVISTVLERAIISANGYVDYNCQNNDYTDIPLLNSLSSSTSTDLANSVIIFELTPFINIDHPRLKTASGRHQPTGSQDYLWSARTLGEIYLYRWNNSSGTSVPFDFSIKGRWKPSV